VKNLGYAGARVEGGDSAAKMLVPAFADELNFKPAVARGVVTFSLKARAAITMGGRLGDAVTGSMRAQVPGRRRVRTLSRHLWKNTQKAHPVAGDYGKTWTPMLPLSRISTMPEQPGLSPRGYECGVSSSAPRQA